MAFEVKLNEDVKQYTFRNHDVLDLPNNKGGSRPSKQAYELYELYIKTGLDVHLEYLSQLSSTYPDYMSKKALIATKLFDYHRSHSKKNPTKIFVNKEILNLLNITAMQAYKLAQFCHIFIGKNHPLKRLIYTFDKYAGNRDNSNETFMLLQYSNFSFQQGRNSKGKSGLYQIRCQGSTTGGNRYSKEFSEKARKDKERFLRFAMHGDDAIPLVCAKSNEYCERYSEEDPVTKEVMVMLPYDYHHIKYAQGKSANKHATKEPSNILSSGTWNIGDKIEILSCIPIRTGAHIEHHRTWRISQDLTWWNAWWDSGKGKRPFVLESEENYNKVLSYFGIPKEETLSYCEFVARLFW